MIKFARSLPAKLILSMFIGIVVGCYVNNIIIMQVVVTIEKLLASFIFFCVPLIVIGFITPSITKLGQNVSKVLEFAFLLAYISSIGAAFMAVFAGFELIPYLSISSSITQTIELPKVVFELNFPPIMNVISALVISVLIGIATRWTKSVTTIKLLEEFHQIILSIVTKVLTPILPFFVGCTFCSLSYEGIITKQLPIFAVIVLIVIIGHFIWLTVLYVFAAIYSKKNPFKILKYYGPAYLTAIGTMSSAATLPIALECARKSEVLDKDMVDFGIPLFSNIHVCGSVLTEVFFVMVVSQIYYGHLPSVGLMGLFCLLLGVFAVGAPGVPGGTVIASLGLITSILGFDSNATVLVLSIFALQDSFGTACNITGDGALTLILTKFIDHFKVNKKLV
ncbi:MAG: dicarboxylate/amino acid:cation symporter [Endomicrobium sp.]|jgi:Na+/H+-dicarboxylate symporter|uniref:dicarboxylate/amino acid:cation symporter n=1 Tax=Candidatus Endomicrobiellum cubanum TaxID=3242325 RepID=UPI002819BE92|nr:dicarboxylate/amino acid:cation symporter [Endomicrobium sp.]